MSFEGTLFPVPNKVEAYLAVLYGDYERLPPAERRRPRSAKIELTQPCIHKEILSGSDVLPE